MSEKKKIFLSYSLEDKNLVSQFKKDLDDNYEILDHPDIEKYDEAWQQNVDKKIDQSSMMLCLFGHGTWESVAVKWEVENALSKEMTILLVKLKPTVFMIPKYIEENNIPIIEYDIEKIKNEIKNE